MKSRAATFFYLIAAAVPALLSFVFFRVVRAGLKLAKARYIAGHPESCREWQVICAAFARRPLVLPLIATGAPRWNPHATIGTLGPVSACRKLSVHAAAARRSAREWFFVIYSHPDHETVGTISCLADSGAEWESIDVPRPGRFVIGARYYHPDSSVWFPEVRADDSPVAAAKEAAGDGAHALYSSLRQRESAFYRALQYYVRAMLRCREFLPAGFVRREFLPVGNPETEFLFGALRSGDPVPLDFSPELFGTNDVYVCVYSRCSFPIAWFELESGQPARYTATEPGFYLVRIQKKKSISSAARRNASEAAALT